MAMAVYALKEIRRFLKGKSLRQVDITLNPAVRDELLKNNADLRFIERKFRARINPLADPGLHIEDIRMS